MLTPRQRAMQTEYTKRYRREQARRRQWLSDIADAVGITVRQLTTEPNARAIIDALRDNK
ncbi:hypothetical protein [Corynebacterium pseudopelargi]|uniref:Uncharacterized protein n=1 Tax=Corynebacterium pseudopelargi TaxID=2080757 RepID=A0A3G6IXE9_9CORY|nr:hypothetical protein [Corynebacterium pseudopelargi]AZA09328.1 hypothetical protein CPPEL_06050 [Corynebacterium pseudopelargi]